MYVVSRYGYEGKDVGEFWYENNIKGSNWMGKALHSKKVWTYVKNEQDDPVTREWIRVRLREMSSSEATSEMEQ